MALINDQIILGTNHMTWGELSAKAVQALLTEKGEGREPQAELTLD